MAWPVVFRGVLHLGPRRLIPATSSVGARIWSLHVDLPLHCHNPPLEILPDRTLHLSSNICAGHNKWSKVKHIKGPKDAARSQMFQKLGLLIRVAVREGGSSNPDLNLQLAQVLEQCRNKNMPKTTVETILKSTEKAKAGVQLTYEARGPGGCMLIIDLLTDNSTRTYHEIRMILGKYGAAMTDAARHSFNRKGVVMVEGHGITTEQALEMAIEVGAEDVQETEDEDEKPHLQFICDMTELKKVRLALAELGVKIVSFGLEFIPHMFTPLPQDQLEDASNLINALHDCPDVVRIWDNIEAQR